MDYLALATACFNFNKKLNKLHVTTDGECFTDKQDCNMHARTLTDAAVKVFERQGEAIVEVSAESTAETIEAATPPSIKEGVEQRLKEQFSNSGPADLLGQQQALSDLLLKVQNAQTAAEVDVLIAGQTNADLLAAANARKAALTA